MPVNNGSGQALTAAPSGSQLTYYGGHVISNVKVYNVNWNSNVSSAVSTYLGSFYAAITQSAHFDWLSEYNTTLNAADGSAGTNQVIGRGSLGGSITLNPSTSGTSVDDTSIQAEITKQIASGTLPAADDNSIYMMNFPKGTTITMQGSASCQVFCAYHGTFKVSGQNVYYGVIPSMEPGSGCDLGCGTDPNYLNNTSSVASHELVEAVTDPEVGLASGGLGKPLAWYNSSQGEIGDICNGQQGSVVGSDGVTYTVQKEWSNSQSACIATNGNPQPPPDAGTPDAGTPDAGTPDAGTPDAGTPPPPGNVLQNGVPATGISGTQSSPANFELDNVSAGQTVTFTITGGTGDADLYARFGQAPTLTQFDCRPYLTGNEESCTLTAPADGNYYVMLNAFQNFTGVSLTGSAQ